jgi:serine phosphatase RsbU (regulator of sigma subunit)
MNPHVSSSSPAGVDRIPDPTCTIHILAQRRRLPRRGHPGLRAAHVPAAVRAAPALEDLPLPSPETIAAMPGLRLAVRYRAAGAAAGPARDVGGDWYYATVTPTDLVLIAIGDVSGHGPTAVHDMLRVYRGVAGLAATCSPPRLLMRWLNVLVHSRDPERTASALAGYFDPGARTFCWAQAGHPPPVLIRDGAPRPLDRPAGVLLGASRDAYEASAIRLRPGDLMLLCTDGLLERRDLTFDDGLATVLRAAIGHTDPEETATAVL